MAEKKFPFGMRSGDHRVDRFCDACGQVDTDPHHIAHQADGTTTDRHIDCCAEAGCPDGSCVTVIGDAGDKRGDALVKHLTGGGADNANYKAQEK